MERGAVPGGQQEHPVVPPDEEVIMDRDTREIPDDAYGRVTNPERFEPLHCWASEKLLQLHTDYHVAWEEDTTNAGLRSRPTVRPTVWLTPSNGNGAPVTVAFHDFPGLAVRFGHWAVEHFPDCGCDGCAETAIEEWWKLNELLTAVVTGRFQETVVIPQRGDAQHKSHFRSSALGASRGSGVPRDEAWRVMGRRRRVFEWQPWQRRRSDTEETANG
jgi:hypothetical protein